MGITELSFIILKGGHFTVYVKCQDLECTDRFGFIDDNQYNQRGIHYDFQSIYGMMDLLESRILDLEHSAAYMDRIVDETTIDPVRKSIPISAMREECFYWMGSSKLGYIARFVEEDGLFMALTGITFKASLERILSKLDVNISFFDVDASIISFKRSSKVRPYFAIIKQDGVYMVISNVGKGYKGTYGYRVLFQHDSDELLEILKENPPIKKKVVHTIIATNEIIDTCNSFDYSFPHTVYNLRNPFVDVEVMSDGYEREVKANYKTDDVGNMLQIKRSKSDCNFDRFRNMIKMDSYGITDDFESLKMNNNFREWAKYGNFSGGKEDFLYEVLKSNGDLSFLSNVLNRISIIDRIVRLHGIKLKKEAFGVLLRESQEGIIENKIVYHKIRIDKLEAVMLEYVAGLKKILFKKFRAIKRAEWETILPLSSITYHYPSIVKKQDKINCKVNEMVGEMIGKMKRGEMVMMGDDGYQCKYVELNNLVEMIGGNLKKYGFEKLKLFKSVFLNKTIDNDDKDDDKPDDDKKPQKESSAFEDFMYCMGENINEFENIDCKDKGSQDKNKDNIDDKVEESKKKDETTYKNSDRQNERKEENVSAGKANGKERGDNGNNNDGLDGSESDSDVGKGDDKKSSIQTSESSSGSMDMSVFSSTTRLYTGNILDFDEEETKSLGYVRRWKASTEEKYHMTFKRTMSDPEFDVEKYEMDDSAMALCGFSKLKEEAIKRLAENREKDKNMFNSDDEGIVCDSNTDESANSDDEKDIEPVEETEKVGSETRILLYDEIYSKIIMSKGDDLLRILDELYHYTSMEKVFILGNKKIKYEHGKYGGIILKDDDVKHKPKVVKKLKIPEEDGMISDGECEDDEEILNDSCCCFYKTMNFDKVISLNQDYIHGVAAWISSIPNKLASMKLVCVKNALHTATYFIKMYQSSLHKNEWVRFYLYNMIEAMMKIRHEIFAKAFLESISLVYTGTDVPLSKYDRRCRKTPDYVMQDGDRLLILEFTVTTDLERAMQSKGNSKFGFEGKYKTELDYLKNDYVVEYYPVIMSIRDRGLNIGELRKDIIKRLPHNHHETSDKYNELRSILIFLCNFHYFFLKQCGYTYTFWVNVKQIDLKINFGNLSFPNLEGFFKNDKGGEFKPHSYAFSIVHEAGLEIYKQKREEIKNKAKTIRDNLMYQLTVDLKTEKIEFRQCTHIGRSGKNWREILENPDSHAVFKEVVFKKLNVEWDATRSKQGRYILDYKELLSEQTHEKFSQQCTNLYDKIVLVNRESHNGFGNEYDGQIEGEVKEVRSNTNLISFFMSLDKFDIPEFEKNLEKWMLNVNDHYNLDCIDLKSCEELSDAEKFKKYGENVPDGFFVKYTLGREDLVSGVEGYKKSP
eukprot:GHVU01070398.1.p1 GENE.GHVU01070398.1~~GHVU01070398.1.p1  ORF type:complete len:1548 (+),score=233.35 GHVU01070398.1:520-4644(+)